jgi:SnoaL-like polyketide cyclase
MKTRQRQDVFATFAQRRHPHRDRNRSRQAEGCKGGLIRLRTQKQTKPAPKKDRQMTTPRNFVSASILAITVALAAGCATTNPKLEAYETAEKIATSHMASFDTLDFDVFTNQKWDRLRESHAQNINVHWPDGHVTSGIDKHIEDLKAMFVYAPDTRIKVHSIKIASGEWTSVVGEMEGTFTQPMPIGDGKSIPPTNKAYKIIMCTVGHWTKDGVMDEEYLFWDNATFMKQLGLGQ